MADEQNLGKVEAKGPTSSDDCFKKPEGIPWKSFPTINITFCSVKSRTLINGIKKYDEFKLADCNIVCESSFEFRNEKKLSVTTPLSDTFVRIISSQPSIKHLSLVGYGLQDVLETFSIYATKLMARCLNLLSIELLAIGDPIDFDVDPRLLKSIFIYEKIKKITLRVKNNKHDFLVIDYDPEISIYARLPYFDGRVDMAEVDLFENVPPMKSIKLYDANIINVEHLLSLVNKSEVTLETFAISFYEKLYYLLEHIYKCKNLQILELGGQFGEVPCVPAVVNENSIELKNLKELTFDGLEGATCEELVTVFSNEEHLKNLNKLTLDFCDSVNDTVLFAVAKGCKNLETFRISSNDAVSDLGIMKLMTMCDRLKVLRITLLKEIRGYFLMHLPMLKERKMEITLEDCSEISSPYIKSLAKDVKIVKLV